MRGLTELVSFEASAARLPDLGRCGCLYDAPKKNSFLYAELTEGCGMTAREIRTALKAYLADYMLPSRVEILPRLPLLANSKIDRQTLKQRMGSTQK